LIVIASILGLTQMHFHHKFRQEHKKMHKKNGWNKDERKPSRHLSAENKVVYLNDENFL